MGDGDMKTETGAVVVNDAPELGTRVELHEGTVGDALQLMDAQRNGVTGMAFLFMALAVSLRIDGKRYTVDELHALPMRCTSALMRIGMRALEINMFTVRDGAEDSDTEPGPRDPKS